MGRTITLKNNILGGYLSFDKLKNIIETRGYILEGEQIDDVALPCSLIQAIPYQYSEVNKFFFPDEVIEYEVDSTASDEHERGAFRYALFNSTRYSHGEIKKIIEAYSASHP